MLGMASPATWSPTDRTARLLVPWVAAPGARGAAASPVAGALAWAGTAILFRPHGPRAISTQRWQAVCTSLRWAPHIELPAPGPGEGHPTAGPRHTGVSHTCPAAAVPALLPLGGSVTVHPLCTHHCTCASSLTCRTPSARPACDLPLTLASRGPEIAYTGKSQDQGSWPESLSLV